MIIRLILSLCVACAVMAADGAPPNVPDPLGLGPRLAAINILQEQRVAIPAGATDEVIFELYREYERKKAGIPSDIERVTAERDAARLELRISKEKATQLQAIVATERESSAAMSAQISEINRNSQTDKARIEALSNQVERLRSDLREQARQHRAALEIARQQNTSQQISNPSPPSSPDRLVIRGEPTPPQKPNADTNFTPVFLSGPLAVFSWTLIALGVALAGIYIFYSIHRHPVPKSIAYSNDQIFGYCTAFAVAISPILPVISIPIVGTRNTLSFSVNFVTISVAVAIVIAAGVFTRFRVAIAAASFVMMGLYAYYGYHLYAGFTEINGTISEDKSELARSLGKAVLASIQVEWGAAIVILAPILAVVGAFVMREPQLGSYTDPSNTNPIQ